MDLEIPDFELYPEEKLADVLEFEIQIYFATGKKPKKSTFSILVSLDILERNIILIYWKDLDSMSSWYAFLFIHFIFNNKCFFITYLSQLKYIIRYIK